jgi:hypothetical protein
MTENSGGLPASAANPGGIKQAVRQAKLRAEIARETSPFLTSKEAAFYLGLADITLRGMRRKGTGPRCRKHGRDWRYHIDDLEAWSLAATRGGTHG